MLGRRMAACGLGAGVPGDLRGLGLGGDGRRHKELQHCWEHGLRIAGEKALPLLTEQPLLQPAADFEGGEVEPLVLVALRRQASDLVTKSLGGSGTGHRTKTRMQSISATLSCAIS